MTKLLHFLHLNVKVKSLVNQALDVSVTFVGLVNQAFDVSVPFLGAAFVGWLTNGSKNELHKIQSSYD